MLGERAREGQANLHAFDSADPGETGGNMPPRLAVVAAAGKGARIHPRSAQVPKVMLEAGGRPLLTRNLELVRDALGIRRVHLIVGHLAAAIRAAYGDGSVLGLDLRYVENPRVDEGLGTLLTVAERHVDGPFVLLLGDELYLESNHAELARIGEPYTAVSALYPTDDAETIRKNYTIPMPDARIPGL